MDIQNTNKAHIQYILGYWSEFYLESILQKSCQLSCKSCKLQSCPSDTRRAIALKSWRESQLVLTALLFVTLSLEGNSVGRVILTLS